MSTAIVTAGGTSEPIDDVRVITNLSTGRFGAEIAAALAERGVEVTLLASKALASHPEWLHPDVTVVPFGSFAELDRALQIAEPPDFLFMAAAVSDYSPVPHTGKLRSDADEMVVRMQRNPKILTELRKRCGEGTCIVGFKLLSGVSEQQLEEVARAQLVKNGLNYTVANDLADFVHGQHPVLLVDERGAERIRGTKAQVAAQLVHRLVPAARGPVHPWLEQVLGRPVVRHPGMALSAPRVGRQPGSLAEARTVYTLLATAAAEGGWPGGDVVVEAAGGVLVGFDGFDEAWADALGAWAGETRDLELSVEVGPILYQNRVVGVIGRARPGAPHGDVPFLLPPYRSQGFGDAVTDRLEQAGRPVTVTDDAAPFLAERAFLPTSAAAGRVTMMPPTIRTDLRRAASISLFDPVGRAVLLGRREVGAWPGYWAFPGGNIEPGETPFEAGLRELEEETGITVDVPEAVAERTIYVAGEGRAYAVTNFRVHTLRQPQPTPTTEITGRWYPLEEAVNVRPMAAGTRRVLRDLVPISLPDR